MFSKVVNRVSYLMKAYVLHDPAAVAVRQWFKDNADATLRLDYPLTEQSIVFDVGGYRGEWASRISERYNPYIFVFEPVPAYFAVIKEKLDRNTKIRVHNYGLSDKTETQRISILGDASSTFRQDGDRITINLRDIWAYINEEEIQKIDLIKINIEGGEYPLLDRMLQQGIVEKCTDIQVQFHEFVPKAKSLREEIRKRLNQTHYLTYDYPFVWENWRRA